MMVKVHVIVVEFTGLPGTIYGKKSIEADDFNKGKLEISFYIKSLKEVFKVIDMDKKDSSVDSIIKSFNDDKLKKIFKEENFYNGTSCIIGFDVAHETISKCIRLKQYIEIQMFERKNELVGGGEREEKAATKIQARIRGRAVRRELKGTTDGIQLKEKSESEEESEEAKLERDAEEKAAEVAKRKEEERARVRDAAIKKANKEATKAEAIQQQVVRKAAEEAEVAEELKRKARRSREEATQAKNVDHLL